MPPSRDSSGSPPANPRLAPDDETLLTRWRDGDRGAGNALFQRHFEAVCRFFRNKAPEAAVQDLIQNTFAACVRAKEQFRGEATFRTYLLRVACHELYGYVRQRKRQTSECLHSSLADFKTSPTAALAQSREQALLLAALRQLQPDFQLALELYYWEGLSGPDLAAVLEIPEGTARSRIRRALSALREAVARIAQDPKTATSTLQNLDGWAAEVRELLGTQAPDQGED